MSPFIGIEKELFSCSLFLKFAIVGIGAVISAIDTGLGFSALKCCNINVYSYVFMSQGV